MPRHQRSMRYGLSLALLSTACGTMQRASVSTSCRPRDETAGWLLERARDWVSPQDSVGAALADSLRVPRARRSQVQWIIDPAICARAAEAYRQTSGRPEGVSGRVYVVRAGQVYIVLDPDFSHQPGERAYTTAIFNAHWQLLTHVGG